MDIAFSFHRLPNFEGTEMLNCLGIRNIQEVKILPCTMRLGIILLQCALQKAKPGLGGWQAL
jgi:hypothetical protein